MKNILIALIALTTLSSSCIKEEDDNLCNCGKIISIDNSDYILTGPKYNVNGVPYGFEVFFQASEKNNCTKVVTDILVKPIGYDDEMSWDEFEHFNEEWNKRVVKSPQIGDDYCRY